MHHIHCYKHVPIRSGSGLLSLIRFPKWLDCTSHWWRPRQPILQAAHPRRPDHHLHLPAVPIVLLRADKVHSLATARHRGRLPGLLIQYSRGEQNEDLEGAIVNHNNYCIRYRHTSCNLRKLGIASFIRSYGWIVDYCWYWCCTPNGKLRGCFDLC